MLDASKIDDAGTRDGLASATMGEAIAQLKPLGKIRNPWAVVGLSLITMLVYWFVWIYKIWNEAYTYGNGQNGIRMWRGGAMIAVFFLGPAALYLLCDHMVSEARKIDSPELPLLFDIRTAVWLLAGGFATSGLFLTAGVVRRLRLTAGIPKPQAGRPWFIALAVIIPEYLRLTYQKEAAFQFLSLAGFIAYMVFLQLGLNNFWITVGAKDLPIAQVSAPQTGGVETNATALSFPAEHDKVESPPH